MSALITCLIGGGTLHKRCGVWVSESAGTERPISGMTVADLGRDGMLTLTVVGKSASAQLTTRGSWFARTAATYASGEGHLADMIRSGKA